MINIEDTKEIFSGNSSATSFEFDFKTNTSSDLRVLLTDAAGVDQQLTLGVHYSVSLNGNQNTDPGGTITYPLIGSPLATGAKLTVLRAAAYTQPTTFTGGVTPSTLESKVDNLTMLAQQLREESARALKGSASDATPTFNLTTAALRAGKYVKFDSSGNVELVSQIVAGTLNQSTFDSFLVTAQDATKNSLFGSISDAGKALFYSTTSLLGSAAQELYKLINPRTSAETLAGFTPVNYRYPAGDSRRANLDVSGVTDVTAQIQGMLNAAGLAASNGDPKEVVIYPGTYKVTRLFIRYSNVYLRLMPGAVLQQTRTGITDAATNGVAPNYAVIHINPLNYVHAPPDGSAGTIENVRVYGGGTVRGPFTTDGAYNIFSMGIVANDCHKCHIVNIKVMDCRAENILLGNSSWNTISDPRIVDCEVTGGGEVGINNARGFFIFNNYVHDSWMMNGVGGNGDGGVIAHNRISNMALGGMTFGGSGAADINACRNVIVANNTIHACNLDNAGAYAMALLDDGATTVPKRNIQVIGNVVTNHTGNLMVACDYTSGNVVFANNIFSGTTGADATLWAVINNNATYQLIGNQFMLGTGNAVRCVDVLSGTPTVILDEGNYYDPGIATSIQGVGDFDIRHQHSGEVQLTATGFSGAAPTANCFFTAKQNEVTLFIPGFSGTSNATTMTLGTLPTYLRPTRAQNFLRPITDNGVNAVALIQVGTSGVITMFKDINGGAFTNTGTKGYSGPYPVTYTRR